MYSPTVLYPSLAMFVPHHYFTYPRGVNIANSYLSTSVEPDISIFYLGFRTRDRMELNVRIS